MDYGSTLRIKLTDNSGSKTFYEEALTLSKWDYTKNFDSALDAFTQGALDTIRDLARDIEVSEKFNQFTDNELVRTLSLRGYTITKDH